MKFITAFFMAWGNFLALPCPYKKWDDDLRNYQLALLPLVGAVAGGLWALLAWGLSYTGIPAELQGFILVIYIFFISGFFHLDGFMDCCDALMSNRDLKERQRILKDSTVGAFAVISVALLIAWWVVVAIAFTDRLYESAILFIIPVISRGLSGFWVLTLRPMGHSQYKKMFQECEKLKYRLITIGLMILAIVADIAITKELVTILVVTAGMVITSSIAVAYAVKKLDGMSGDVSGFSLCLSEAMGIMVLVAAM